MSRDENQTPNVSMVDRVIDPLSALVGIVAASLSALLDSRHLAVATRPWSTEHFECKAPCFMPASDAGQHSHRSRSSQGDECVDCVMLLPFSIL